MIVFWIGSVKLEEQRQWCVPTVAQDDWQADLTLI